MSLEEISYVETIGEAPIIQFEYAERNDFAIPDNDSLVITATLPNYEAQALADFVFEIANLFQEESPTKETWLLPMDGSATSQRSRASIVITSPQAQDMEFVVKYDFKASNNEAKYEALAMGMRMAHKTEARHFIAYSDSQLMVRQMDKTYKGKENNIV
ncbi:hypothetical protein Sango_2423600 [Sesamum angolense]|uniref:RNase H type-1 domain-containing protein n=1 Tax=Sesamum angolense TaxID=2727404 RepID=A0AAE1W7G4_9LAMI|nr:hypothetical protein Sango_2423600 [Sesamum angolense]